MREEVECWRKVDEAGSESEVDLWGVEREEVGTGGAGREGVREE